GDLPHLERRRVAERQRRQIEIVHPHDRQVGVGIVAHQLGGPLPAVERRQRDSPCAVHDVAVGQNVAIPRGDETRNAAGRLGGAAGGPALRGRGGGRSWRAGGATHRGAPRRGDRRDRLRIRIERRVVRSAPHLYGV